MFVGPCRDNGASQVALMVKNPPANAGDIRDADLIPGFGRSPGRAHVSPHQYSCLENSKGQRSLVGYSPWGRKESHMVEETEHAHTHIRTKRGILTIHTTAIYGGG